MLCQILLVKADMREIQPAISADHRQFDAALLQRLSDARGKEALSRCIDPIDSDKQGVLRRARFSLLDNRRTHRTIFEHELQLRSVITAGSDLLAAKRVPDPAMLPGWSDRLFGRAELRPAWPVFALHQHCWDARESTRKVRYKYSCLTKIGPFVPFRKSNYGFNQPPIAWIGGAVSPDLTQAARAVALSVSALLESKTVPAQRLP